MIIDSQLPPLKLRPYGRIEMGIFITFHVRRSRGKMYIGHARLCIYMCVCVCLSLAACHYCMDSDVTWGNGRGCPLVVDYRTDLRSVHRFRCYDDIAQMQNVSECLYSRYAWLLLPPPKRIWIVVCLSVCLLVTLRKNFGTGLH